MTSFEELQNNYRRLYNLDPTQESFIRGRLPHPKYFDLISNRLGDMPQTNIFYIDSYNNIKDHSWPECVTLEELYDLPDHIKKECREIHRFDFEIYKDTCITPERWANCSNGEYPISQLIKYKHTVLDLEPWIRNKKILDLAGHAGMTGLVCLHTGASSVVTTNVRSEYVELANACVGLSEYADRFRGVVADLHDYSKTTKLAAEVDTVLLYGVLYHVHDHFDILRSITQACPSTIVIDTDQPQNVDNSLPLMQWLIEDTASVWNGYYQNLSSIPVGVPTQNWIEMIMNMLNYKLCRIDTYKGSQVGTFSLDTLSDRLVLVFQHKSQ